MTVITRAELLKRVRRLVERVRLARGNASGSLFAELRGLEADATDAEAEIAAAIDAHQDRIGRRHNLPLVEPDPEVGDHPVPMLASAWRSVKRRRP